MRTSSIATAAYTPGPLPSGANLARYLEEELNRIAAALSRLGDGTHPKTMVAPGKPRMGDIRYADGTGTNWNPWDGEGLYLFDGTNWRKLAWLLSTDKTKATAEGGVAVKLTNRTGGASVKGEVVTTASAHNNAVIKIVKDVPNPIGVFYESGIADGSEAWVVVSGIADVYFVGNTTRGHLARGFLTADGASYVTGQALSESVPSSPFASDKHFYEIGHVLESRTGAGLAKCVLHFN